jgi:hypothetical protein
MKINSWEKEKKILFLNGLHLEKKINSWYKSAQMQEFREWNDRVIPDDWVVLAVKLS